MELGLREATVLVTGGSNGIGTAIARAFVEEGSRVATTYFSDADAGERVVEEALQRGGQAMAMPYDLADPGGADSIVDQVLARWGRLDVVIANAVRWPILPNGQQLLADADPPAWRHAVRVNLEGTTALLRRAALEMMTAGAGRIVVVTTEVAEVGMAGATAYSTAKAGLHGLVASLRWELGPRGILINMISPGFNLTPRNLANFPDEVREQVRRRTPTGRLSTPEDAAPTVVFLASQANRNITGEFISVSGGAD